MSTLFYYHKTGVRPITPHFKGALISGRGCKAQQIQFRQRGIVTADCFSLDPHKSKFIKSHQELFRKNIFIL